MEKNYLIWSRGRIISDPMTHKDAIRKVEFWNKPFSERDKARAIRFTKSRK